MRAARAAAALAGSLALANHPAPALAQEPATAPQAQPQTHPQAQPQRPPPHTQGLDPEQDAAQAYQQAREALAAGQTDRAEILLERVLMLMPEHAEARIDFAALMARRGQWELARSLLVTLIDDPRTPAEHRQRLERLARRVAGLGAATEAEAAAPAPAPAWRAEAQWAYSSNPLARTSAPSLTLGLPDGPVTLPLASRPRPGALSGLALQHQRGPAGVELALQRLDGAAAVPRAPADGGPVTAAAAWRLSAWGPLPRAGAAAAPGETAAPATAPTPGLAWSWALSTQRQFDGQSRHTLGAAATLGEQRYSLAAYQEPQQADRGALLRAERAFPLAGLALLAGAELSHSSVRRQGYARLSGVGEWALGGGATRLQGSLSAQQDLQGYSPLLQEGAHRRLLTLGLVLERPLQVAGLPAPLVLRAFWSRRLSNLALFDYQDFGAQAALAWRW